MKFPVKEFPFNWPLRLFPTLMTLCQLFVLGDVKQHCDW